MSQPDSYSHQRYLFAKNTVTERGLNQHVWNCFIERVRGLGEDGEIEVLDVGAGTGHMALRFIKALGRGTVKYTIVDKSKQAIEGVRRAFGNASIDVHEQNESHLIVKNKDVNIIVNTVQKDIFDHLGSIKETPTYHVVVAQSILDLIPINAFARQLKPLLEKNNVFYSAETFNRVTTFLPTIDTEQSTSIIKAYHGSMTDVTPHGQTAGPETGRKALQMLRENGAHLEAAGSSDWIVLGSGGDYPADEAYFLYHILHFIEKELTGHSAIDQAYLRSWLKTRRSQVEAGTLIFIAHQLDALASFS